MPDQQESLITQRSLITAGILSLLLVGSIVFTGLSWNSGNFEKSYESIYYEVEYVEKDELLEGVEYIAQVGQVGSKVIYSDAESGETFHEEISKQPVNEVVVRGTKSIAEVEREIVDFANSYGDAWKANDFEAMAGMALEDSLRGSGAQDIEDAYKACTEHLESYAVGQMEIYPAGEWAALDTREYYYDDLRPLSGPPSLGDAEIVCELELDMVFSSVLCESFELHGLAYLVFSGGSWKMQYFGPLKVIQVGETQDVVEEDWWSGQTHRQVTFESIILYTDHFSLLMSEKNLTPRDDEDSWASNEDSSLLRDVYVEVMPEKDLDWLGDLSTQIPYDLERGQSQLGLLSYEPDLGSGDTVSVEAGDKLFSLVTIP